MMSFCSIAVYVLCLGIIRAPAYRQMCLRFFQSWPSEPVGYLNRVNASVELHAKQSSIPARPARKDISISLKLAWTDGRGKKKKNESILQVLNADDAIPLAALWLLLINVQSLKMYLQPVLMVVGGGRSVLERHLLVVELHVHHRGGRLLAAATTALQEKGRGRASALLHLGYLGLGRR